MGTGRKFQKKPMTRPIKTPIERKRREKVQRARLVKLGMTEEEVRHLTARDMRELLRKPAAIGASKE